MQLRTIFYAVILLEGYSVLAFELLAIRLLLPFVGSSVEIVAILVASVLMPLAIGYYVGGRFTLNRKKSNKFISIREKLIRNLVLSIVILSVGLSHKILSIFFFMLGQAGIEQGIIQTALYVMCFIVYPVFLLGQTVPLVSNYFSQEDLSETTGKMLFFSTVGSFLGSLVSTLVLVSTIGVHNTVIVTVALLVLTIILLGKRRFDINYAWAGMALVLVILLNNNNSMKKLNVVENNNYSTVQISNVPQEDAKLMMINNSYASKYSSNFEMRFSYVKYIENTFLKPYQIPNKPKLSILVIGAGGCVLGIDDTHNEYTFVDIDGSLKEISEKYLIEKPLTDNKQFITASARLFLRGNHKKYDVIILDVYNNATSIPSELVTEDFFTQVKSALSPTGMVIANIIASPNFHDRYSIRLDNSLRAVFPNMNRQIINDYSLRQPQSKGNSYDYVNIIYSYYHTLTAQGTYTDDKNTYFLDKKKAP